MIAFDVDGIWFQYRAGAVCLVGGDVLLHHAEGDRIWALPGGHCEVGELAHETVRREMREETGADVTVGPLMYVVDNHFTHGGKRVHEPGLYFACELPPDHPFTDRDREHVGVEDARGEALRLVFRWFPVASLAELSFYPFCLRDALAKPWTGTRYLAQPDTPENRTTDADAGLATEGA